jgi:hypothetical protein
LGDALGDALASPVVDWQKRRVIRAQALIQDAASQLEVSGIEPVPVPGRVLMPLLERGSLEEHEELRKKWANLLASAASPGTQVPPGFVSILGDLAPLEAMLLDIAFEQHAQGDDKDIIASTICEDELGMNPLEAESAIGNIERLGLWRRRPPVISAQEVMEIAEHKDEKARMEPHGYKVHLQDIFLEDDTGVYVFTMMGFGFMSMCSSRYRIVAERQEGPK